MHHLAVPRSPPSVVYSTILLLIATGAALLLSLLFAWLEPVWSRTVILLQVLALLVVGLVARWRPSWRLAVYPLLLAYMTYLWDPTLPPPHLPEGWLRALLPLALSVGIGGDLLLAWSRSRPFTPKRLPVHAGFVNLDEAACFLRLPPEVVRARLVRAGYPLLPARTGEDYVAIEDLPAALAAVGSATDAPARSS